MANIRSEDSEHRTSVSPIDIPARPIDDEAIARMWSFYLEKAEKLDREKVDSWKGDMDGLLIFTGLFSATVAAFIIQSYQLLQPDTDAATVSLLVQISNQLNGSQPLSDIAAQTATSPIPRSSVLVNCLWLLSLGLSISCALTAVMIQQWGRRYLRTVTTPQQDAGMRARIQLSLLAGAEKFGLETFIAAVPTVLHISIFLFFAGLVEFYRPVNHTTFIVVLVFVGAFSVVFLALTIAPLIFINCAYSTPLSPTAWKFLAFVISAWHRMRQLFTVAAIALSTVGIGIRRGEAIVSNNSSSFLERWKYILKEARRTQIGTNWRATFRSRNQALRYLAYGSLDELELGVLDRILTEQFHSFSPADLHMFIHGFGAAVLRYGFDIADMDLLLNSPRLWGVLSRLLRPHNSPSDRYQAAITACVHAISATTIKCAEYGGYNNFATSFVFINSTVTATLDKVESGEDIFLALMGRSYRATVAAVAISNLQLTHEPEDDLSAYIKAPRRLQELAQGAKNIIQNGALLALIGLIED